MLNLWMRNFLIMDDELLNIVSLDDEPLYDEDWIMDLRLRTLDDNHWMTNF